MDSNISHSNSQTKLLEDEKLKMNINENPDDNEQEEEEEEATVPKLNNETILTTPLLSNKKNLIRENSFSSTDSKQSNYTDICRICHCESTYDEPLISPCLCLGTMQYLHQSCLQRWIKSSGVKSCELCKFEFIMHSEIKPFKQWQKLDMNVVERRKIMCSVAFNLIAVTCVLWSLYVLIDKTREEVKAGKLQWPFWTKLIVVAIGFTGGLVFLYVQCKMYLQLCLRWRQFNQSIIIHSISKQHESGILLSGIKNSSNDNNNIDCIVTVLDANDLPPLNSNTSLADINGSNSIDLTTSQLSNTRRSENNNNRNVLHRFLIFHRSDQPQI